MANPINYWIFLMAVKFLLFKFYTWQNKWPYIRGSITRYCMLSQGGIFEKTDMIHLRKWVTGFKGQQETNEESEKFALLHNNCLKPKEQHNSIAHPTFVISLSQWCLNVVVKRSARCRTQMHKTGVPRTNACTFFFFSTSFPWNDKQQQNWEGPGFGSHTYSWWLSS